MSSVPSSQSQRIYLDHAATSFPKPPGVMEAMVAYATELGANAGRGGYDEALRSSDIIAGCRRKLAKLLNAPRADSIVFTFNCTDALNLAINGVVDDRRRQHFICTVMDHNSILRPLHELVDRGLGELTIVQIDPSTGVVNPDDIRKAIRPETALIAVTHASNVTGAIVPLDEISGVAREHDVLLLVDAAQTAGHIPIDVQQTPVDLLAAPGHKGLLGPLGTGALYIRPGVEKQIHPLRSGGTGSQSEFPIQPSTMPDRYEAGSPNVIGLAGWSAALDWIGQRGVEALRRHEGELGEAFLGAIQSVTAIRLFGPRESADRVGVFSFEIDAYSPAELSMILESQFEILARAGLHCAPLMHQALGTQDRGGTVRASFGPFTTREDVDRLADSLKSIVIPIK